MEVCPTHACAETAQSAILPRPTEPRRNLRHSERSERGGKVPEGLRLTGEGCSRRPGKDATADQKGFFVMKQKFVNKKKADQFDWPALIILEIEPVIKQDSAQVQDLYQSQL